MLKVELLAQWRHDGQPDVQEKCRMGPRGKHAVEGENGCAGGDGEGRQDDELTNTWRGNSNRIAFQIGSQLYTYCLVVVLTDPVHGRELLLYILPSLRQTNEVCLGIWLYRDASQDRSRYHLVKSKYRVEHLKHRCSCGDLEWLT